MSIYQLKTGILKAKLVRYAFNYVIIEIQFEGSEAEYLKIPTEEFNGIDSWVNNNYDVITILI